jgi:hypothetical protein
LYGCKVSHHDMDDYLEFIKDVNIKKVNDLMYRNIKILNNYSLSIEPTKSNESEEPISNGSLDGPDD